jgi:hypothetical protein
VLVVDGTRIDELLALQCGVICRRQVLACRGSDNDIERLVRRREWAPVHVGVYVNHTGPLTWTQRAWAACLLHWPAALGGASALEAHGLSGEEPAVIDLVVAHGRRVHDPPGVRTRVARDFDAVAQLHLGPPRVRVERAVLDVASRARSDDAAVAVIADACQSRRTTPGRLSSTLSSMPRLPRRRLLLTILEDVASGAYSALERRYLAAVERPHGLPTADRQRRVRSGRTVAYRDVEYVGLGVVAELDGRLGHEKATDSWADMERDLESVVDGDLTLRIGWRQVLSPCRLAGVVGRVLAARGWTGTLTRCGPDCHLADRGDPSAPGAGRTPRSAP